MKLMLDTHLLLWAASQPGRLSATARLLMEDTRNDLYFSAASLWEVAIKQGLGRADFVVNPPLLLKGLLAHGYRELAITSQHALGVAALPPLHKDPFDRLLVSQALAEGILLLTTDAQVAQYPAPVKLV